MNEGMIRELPREGRLTRSIPRDLERSLLSAVIVSRVGRLRVRFDGNFCYASRLHGRVEPSIKVFRVFSSEWFQWFPQGEFTKYMHLMKIKIQSIRG